MLIRLLLAAALAAGLSSAAQAQVARTVTTCGAAVDARANDSAGLTRDVNGNLCGTAATPDGANVSQGAKADAQATNATGSWSVIALLKGLYTAMIAPTPAGANIIGKVGIDQSTLGTTNAVANQVYDLSGGFWRSLNVTTSGALIPPTAASGKITETSVALAANTSTQLVGAGPLRIGLEIQCDGTAPVGIGRTGATLTSVAASGAVVPAGSFPLYTMPIASLTAITAYTGTAQTCRVTEYLR